MAVLPRHSFWSGIRKLQVYKRSSNRVVIVESAERLMGVFLGEQKGKGLKLAANVQFWIQNYFSLKKKMAAIVSFAVVL